MKKTIVIISRIVTVAIMVTIFCFSAQCATESSETSGGFTYAVLSLFPSFRALGEAEQTAAVDGVSTLVRKTAHFSLYLVLAVFMNISLSGVFKKKRLRFFCGWLACAAYSVSDEIHQYFVPGRSCEIRDMLIDSSGALCGTLLVLLAVTLINKKINRKNSVQ